MHQRCPLCWITDAQCASVPMCQCVIVPYNRSSTLDAVCHIIWHILRAPICTVVVTIGCWSVQIIQTHKLDHTHTDTDICVFSSKETHKRHELSHLTQSSWWAQINVATSQYLSNSSRVLTCEYYTSLASLMREVFFNKHTQLGTSRSIHGQNMIHWSIFFFLFEPRK